VILKDGFQITERVFMVLEGESPTSMAKTTGLGVLELATVFDNLKPDIVVTVADRYETLATAVAASYMNLPLAHVQGGEVSGSIDEKVRHAVTKLADLHFVSTRRAGERVTMMGEDPATVHWTGCPSIDLAAEILPRSELDFDPMQKYGGVGAPLDLSKGYMVVMQHPVTTEYQLARSHVLETLHAVHELGLPTEPRLAFDRFARTSHPRTSTSSRTWSRRISCVSCTTRDVSSETPASGFVSARSSAFRWSTSESGKAAANGVRMFSMSGTRGMRFAPR
jgi:UDP-hydrolysing UDP-N-acetyl-D-glucosamine 2-epimerase